MFNSVNRIVFVISFFCVASLKAQPEKNFAPPDGNLELLFEINRGVPTFLIIYKGH